MAVPFVLLLHLLGKMCPKVKPITNRFFRYMFYSGSMRFFMEGYLDFCLFSLLNVTSLDWSGAFSAVTLCNYMAIFITVLACPFPIFILVWYLLRMHLWDTEEFKEKWGTVLDNLDIGKEDGKWVVIILPVSYFVRRLAFVLVLVFWYEFLWGQIAIMTMLSVAMIIFINWCKPMESRFMSNMETFNECIALCTIYSMMSLSDAVPDTEIRNDYGEYFIAVLCFYLGVHTLILFGESCYRIKSGSRQLFNKCSKKESLQKQYQKQQLKREALVQKQKDIDILKKKVQAIRARRQSLTSQREPSAVVVIHPLKPESPPVRGKESEIKLTRRESPERKVCRNDSERKLIKQKSPKRKTESLQQ